MNKEIVKFSYIIVFALLLSSILNYAYQIVMGIMLPKNEFGILGVSLSILYIASVLTQSTFSWSGTRRLSLNLDTKIFRTTLYGNLILALFASIIIIILSINSKTYLLPNLIVASVVTLSAISSSLVSLLRAVKKFYHIAAANVLTSTLKLVFALFLVILGLEAIGALAALMFASAITTIFLYISARNVNLLNSKGFEFDMIRETFYVSLVFLSVTFIVNSSIVFERFLSNSDVLTGIYNASLTIARGSFFLASALITVLFPYVSSKSKKSEKYAFQLIKYSVLFIFPISLLMVLNPRDWLIMFFGNKYLEGFNTLRLLSIGIGFISVSFIISSNLVAFEKAKISAIALLFACVLQSILALSGYPAISVVISSLLTTVVLTIYYKKYFYFKVSLIYLIKIMMGYIVLSVIMLINTNSRIISLVYITVVYTLYVIFLAILKLFDIKDVDVLLAPLPSWCIRFTRKIIIKLNKLI